MASNIYMYTMYLCAEWQNIQLALDEINILSNLPECVFRQPSSTSNDSGLSQTASEAPASWHAALASGRDRRSWNSLIHECFAVLYHQPVSHETEIASGASTENRRVDG